MAGGEELLDCMFLVDEMLSEAEEALEEQDYSTAIKRVKEARDAISDLREDNDVEDDRQEVDLHVATQLK